MAHTGHVLYSEKVHASYLIDIGYPGSEVLRFEKHNIIIALDIGPAPHHDIGLAFCRDSWGRDPDFFVDVPHDSSEKRSMPPKVRV